MHVVWVSSSDSILSLSRTTRSALTLQVRCFDPDDKSGVPLASYELDGKPTGAHTAVVMCKIWRPAPGKSWKVTAIGELGAGKARDYGPMHDLIARLK